MSKITRRGFLQTTSAAAGASFLITGTKASGNIVGANERVRIAVAGLNGRGKSHMGGWMGQDNVEIAYLADPDKKVLDRADYQGKPGKTVTARVQVNGKQITETSLQDADTIMIGKTTMFFISVWMIR